MKEIWLLCGSIFQQNAPLSVYSQSAVLKKKFVDMSPSWKLKFIFFILF